MSENKRHEIYDQYMELVKVAMDSQTLTDNILELLHTQGKMLGLSLEEMRMHSAELPEFRRGVAVGVVGYMHFAVGEL